MSTWKDVKRIALALPVTEEVHRGTATWRVRDKLFVWERPLRPSDLRALGDQAPRGAILGVRVESLVAKEARLAAQPDVLFTTPHFDGYPAVLVRLGKIKVSDLEELLVEAWLARAPKRLAKEYLGEPGKPTARLRDS
jgi:hypothetical protein